jgi:hypothetical protein
MGVQRSQCVEKRGPRSDEDVATAYARMIHVAPSIQ